jgi:hypothetical protein
MTDTTTLANTKAGKYKIALDVIDEILEFHYPFSDSNFLMTMSDFGAGTPYVAIAALTQAHQVIEDYVEDQIENDDGSEVQM